MDRPQRSSVPGRKFSTMTSTFAAQTPEDFLGLRGGGSRGSSSACCGRPFSRRGGTPSLVPPQVRMLSPSGCSTLTTSAPKSPSHIAAIGAAMNDAISSTRIFARGPWSVTVSSHLGCRGQRTDQRQLRRRLPRPARSRSRASRSRRTASVSRSLGSPHPPPPPPISWTRAPGLEADAVTLEHEFPVAAGTSLDVGAVGARRLPTVAGPQGRHVCRSMLSCRVAVSDSIRNVLR